MTQTITPTTDEIGSIQVEVIGSALESLCDEMGETLVRTSYSPNIKERRDCTTALFDAHGNTLAQAEHIPIHLGSLVGIVHGVMAQYPLEEIRDGDAFLGNDPYEGGGTHLHDIVLVTPIFVDGQLRTWATNLAHHSDFADRRHHHIFEEGLRIPPIRFVWEGEYEPDVLRFILTNMQVPAERIADFNAQVASNRLAVERYREICGKYGAETVAAAGTKLLDYTERKIRAGIRSIPDGTYRFADTFDYTGLPETHQMSVEIAVTDDEIRLDFDAPAQVRAGFNVVKTALEASVYYAIKTLVGPDIPSNSGLYRPITVDAPRGSILNCVSPAAVNVRTMTCQRVVDLVHGALANVLPDRVIAACNGAVASMVFSGVDPRTGTFYVYGESIGGGLGAGCGGDGLDGVQAHITNTSNLPVESLEAEYPLTVTRYELVEDSGGVGQHRGGQGIHRQIRADHDDCRSELETSRIRSAPWGLFGGGAGAPSRIEINGHAVDTVGTVLARGDAASMFTAGGGGYGEPGARSADDVATDIREQRLSIERARAAYGPAADPDPAGPGEAPPSHHACT
ncbi:hydantoinase B/oxoprolinase family protein [Ruania alkalisoli]|uniref:Hydantoinase B/oxoprolinase family protein n=1 Tax=Ruania alkalisoli TaxID=2779775 RepID=A0A7M1SSR3_9MICO|nr:hydantoinase B/oxoprolinase family protein [Ruania alkalisoli]QOR70590.1 hydantoinase B/oxoprolinase family protein [Ruania alkalisoli]